MTKISFVIPCYRSEKTIEFVVKEIIETVSYKDTYDYEIICVNDCSPDNLFHILCDMAKNNERIKVVNLSINAGKHAAVLAGYAYATGDIIVNLDDDGQCPVYDLWKLIDPLEEDEFDVVTAKYRAKKEAVWKRMGSSFNHWISSVLLDKPRELRMENFSAMKAFVAREMVKYTNPYAYLDGLIFRVTRRIKMVEMEERSRADDNTSGFTLRKSIALFSNGLTAFSVKPLRVSSIIGFVAAAIGFIWSIVLLICRLAGRIGVAGYTSTIVIQLILGGLILMSLGMLGEYIGRMYICLNKSPQYVVKETINCEKK